MEWGYIRYDWRLKQRARENRKNMTEAEQKIWDFVLKQKRLLGFKFTRQKMLDYFIVDFYCSKLQLIIEIDGDYHNERKEYDFERENRLKKLWLNIIRFTNKEILDNIDLVKNKLEIYIKNKLLNKLNF